MQVIAVDDEELVLETLINAIKESPDITNVRGFVSCTEALQWVTSNPVDIAFLDINMRGMGGLTLAEHIMEMCPQCKIVFCTGYSEYAVSAFQMHVSGYLLKPITAQSVQKEIDHIKKECSKEKLLTVRCFGNFEVFYKGELLGFKRTKTKELLACLIDRRGAAVTTKQICAKLWEDNNNEARNVNYMYQLLDDLRHSLRAVGAEKILNRGCATYAVDITMVDCDYYRYLECGKPEFLGEYMIQYSWAEETSGLLWRKKYKKDKKN